MNRRRILMEISPNINENSKDSIFKMKEITKIANRCNQTNAKSIQPKIREEKIEYIPCNQNINDEYIQDIKKHMHHQKKFLKFFNVNSLESVINMYSDLKCRNVQLEKKNKFIKEKYKSKIKNLQLQNKTNQNKIELLEKTVESLHNENDKIILIIETLQNENAVLCEKNISDNLNKKVYAKTMPITNINCNISNDLILIENNNLKIKCQKQEIEYQNLQIEYQKLEIANRDLENINQKYANEYQNLLNTNQELQDQNQNLQIEINNLKNEIIQINKDKTAEIHKIELNYSNNKKQDYDQLNILANKYKKQNELLKLNKNALEAENKTLLASLSHQSFLKRSLKNLKRQNFKLEIEVENLKMKNFKSPFQSPNKSKPNDMLDIGIITSFSENNNIISNDNESENTDFQKYYLIEKERRKLLAILLSRIIKMFDVKCNQLLFDFSTLMDSQSARIQNIITVLHES